LISYIGFGTASAGPYFEFEANMTNHEDDFSHPKQGWPLDNRRQTFATVAGFYDCQPTTPRTNFPELQKLGCESVISGIPYPLAFDVVVGDQVLNASVATSTISGYESSMDFKNGIRSYNFTWSPAGANFSIDIEITALVSRNRPNVAAIEYRMTTRSIQRIGSSWLRWMNRRFPSRVTGPTHNITLVDHLEGRSAVRSSLGEKGSNSNSSIHISNHPNGKPDVTAWTVSTASVSNGYTDESSRSVISPLDSTGMSIGQQWDIRLVEGKPATFCKFIGIASSDHFPDPKAQAFEESESAARDGFKKVHQEHTRAWNIIMDPNRLTDYRDPSTGKLPDDATIKILHASNVVSAFSLLQNLNTADSGLDDEGVAVSGLTSDAYAGHRFWDGELYMFPPIGMTWPHFAHQFAAFRIKQYPQALENAQASYVQEKYAFDNESALFPWTSGRWGNATATGPVLDYEYHINGDIAIMLLSYHAITGDDRFFDKHCWPIVNSVAHSYGTLLSKDGDGWSIRNMTDPDEYAVRHLDSFLLMSSPYVSSIR
jgi:trehalose/maltose hydrolase-like predicted phosphorylase